MTPIPNFRWLIATMLFLSAGLSFFDRQVLSVLAPRITSDLAMDNVAYSRVIFAFILSYSIMFTGGGWIIDRLGTFRGLALSVGVWTLASLFHATANNALQLGFCRFFLGVGEGGCFPGAAKGVLEWFPKKERAIAMGFATAGGSAIGAVVAPPLIVLASHHIGWRGAFLMTGVIGGIWIALWLLTYSRPEDSRFLSGTERRYIAQGTDRSSAVAVDSIPWRDLLTSKRVWGLISARFLFDPAFYFYMFWIPQYLSQERGASLDTIGQLTWIPFLALGISSVLGGWASDRLLLSGFSVIRARKTILAASALLTPVSILALYVHTVEMAILLMSVLMFAHGFWITNYMTMIGDLFPSRIVATVVGLTGTSGGIGGFLSSLVIGKVVQAASFNPVFIAAGVVYPVCAAILLVSIRDTTTWELSANL